MHFRGSRPLWGDLLRQGLPVGIGGLLTLGYGYVDQVIVFEVAGVRDAGLYGAVYRIYERVQFLPAAIMTTLFPLFVTARDHDPERVRRLFHTAVDYLVLTSLPAFTITLAGAEPITRLLFGADFADAAPALPLLMATFVVVSLGYLTGYLIVAYNLQRRFLLIAIGALVFNVATNLALVPSYGFMAAAWLTLATEVVVMSLSMWIVCSTMGVAPTGHRARPDRPGRGGCGPGGVGPEGGRAADGGLAGRRRRALRRPRHRARRGQARGAARAGAPGGGVNDGSTSRWTRTSSGRPGAASPSTCTASRPSWPRAATGSTCSSTSATGARRSRVPGRCRCACAGAGSGATWRCRCGLCDTGPTCSGRPRPCCRAGSGCPRW